MSPQRDDVPALTRTLAHNFRLFGRLFCEQFVLFSILQLVQQIRVLSVNCILPLGHFVRIRTQRHTVAPLWLDLLPRTTKKNKKKTLVLSFVIYCCRWSHHFMTSPPSSPSSPCARYIYSDFYHFLSFPGLSASFGVYVYSDASPSPTPHPSRLPTPLHPRVQLLLPASFP